MIKLILSGTLGRPRIMVQSLITLPIATGLVPRLIRTASSSSRLMSRVSYQEATPALGQQTISSLRAISGQSQSHPALHQGITSFDMRSSRYILPAIKTGLRTTHSVSTWKSLVVAPRVQLVNSPLHSILPQTLASFSTSTRASLATKYLAQNCSLVVLRAHLGPALQPLQLRTPRYQALPLL